ncbi:MAG: hypothetical protein K6G03_08970 [Lachnospiraceae bacterium]|nr:hypothetical protein [Lachnospiraceae bacterium]
MADIKINPIAERSTIQNPAVRQQNTQNAQNAQNNQGIKDTKNVQEAAGRTGTQSEQKNISEKPELEDLIAVSKDGDTVQASETAKERLEEDAFGHVEVKQEALSGNNEAAENTGISAMNETEANANGLSAKDGSEGVTGQAIAEQTEAAIEGTERQQAIKEAVKDMIVNGSRTEEAIEESNAKSVSGQSRTEEAIELGAKRSEAEEEEEEYIKTSETQQHEDMVSTYQGISDMRLEQMRIEGKISQSDYDREMEAREEARKDELEEAGKFSTQMTGAEALEESGERDEAQIQTVFSDEANDNIEAADRMQILQSLDAATAVTGDNASGEETARRVVIKA